MRPITIAKKTTKAVTWPNVVVMLYISDLEQQEMLSRNLVKC